MPDPADTAGEAAATLPARTAAHWRVTLDGPAWRGHMSTVWPVRGPAGEAWVVKITDAHHPPTGEGVALEAWAATHPGRSRVVHLIARFPDPTAEGEALLLQRLSERSLADVADAEVADAELSNALADLGGVAAPAEIPSTATKLAGMAEGIRRHREEAGAARSVPQRQVAAALDFLASLANDPAAGADRSLCHGDLHYLNVLRDRGDAGWRVIDPLPSAGLREIDVVAALRNRYDDALATGDPDRALARRCDRLCEAGGLDRTVARALSQAVAVDNLLWLLPRDPTNAFVAPYAVLTGWH